ncbi:glycosyltransferase family 4 protein [Rhodopseudomonas sp. G2_2311]|uniref:glycosyltransferase family 4 protein n=1 Tax=Rhodopseudomonas sp. G2_2311 TaxID=3114287 RepID=UPI0039C67C1F
MSQHFWPETFRINEVVESLMDAGCEVTVLAGQPNYPDGKIFAGYGAARAGRSRHPAGYTICRVPIIPRGKSGALRLFANYMSFVVSAAVIGPFLLRGQTYDVVFVYAISPILQAIPAIFIRYLKSASLVIWVQDLWPRSLEATGYVKNSWILASVAAVTKWIYSRADLLLVPSRGLGRLIAPAAASTRIAFHPNPAETAVSADHSSQPISVEFPLGFSVVFAGNIGTAQALDTVIDAAELLINEKDIHFQLIGSGSRLAYLMDEVRRRRLSNVSFPGRYPPEAMSQIYARSSALLASLVHDDGLAEVIPSKVQTYLAAGRPIIAALEGEGAEIVRSSGAGLVVPPEDCRALVDAILRLKRMPKAEQDAMGDAGRKFFREHFDPKRLAAALTSHFEDAISSRRR